MLISGHFSQIVLIWIYNMEKKNIYMIYVELNVFCQNAMHTFTLNHIQILLQSRIN